MATYQAVVVAQTTSGSSSSNLCRSVATQTWSAHVASLLLHKPAASEGADGEVRGSRSSLVRMRDVDPPEVPLRQAPYNPPQDVASNSGSLVQVAEQAHPLVQRCPSPNPMREHRNNRTHEEVVVGGGATPHG